MSSSDRNSRPTATPWALDELEMPDVFTPLHIPVGAPQPHAPAGSDAGEELASPQERARIEAAAYARGRADGEKLTRAELQPRIESAAAALDEALRVVEVHQGRWMANVEENIAVVAVVAARHLIAREVEADATIVGQLVQRALAQFPLDHRITVRLHPDDVDTCDQQLKAAEPRRAAEVRFAADPLVQRGGALVEGRERIIDGRVDTALERAYRLLGNIQA